MKELVAPQITERHDPEEDGRGVLLTTCWDPNENVEREIGDDRIRSSLSAFAERLNGDGLAERIQKFAKTDAPSEEFVLKAVLKGGSAKLNDDGSGKFYLDGDYSFALGYMRGKRRTESLWLAVISFSFGPEVEYSAALEVELERKDPLIVQIQGLSKHYHSSEKKYYEGRRVLRQFGWERALVGLVLEWAESVQIPSVYLLPSLKNRYRYKNPRTLQNIQLNERLHMRYDITARRMGFQKVENGLFRAMIDLSPDGGSRE